MAEHGFGIIGCGMIAEFHTRAINEIDNARVVGAWSRNAGQRRQDRRLADGGCPTFDDLDALLAVPELDVVCICTPSGAHLEPAIQAARAGKHVVVEKPLEITLPRCDAIIDGLRRRRRSAVHDLSRRGSRRPISDSKRRSSWADSAG